MLQSHLHSIPKEILTYIHQVKLNCIWSSLITIMSHDLQYGNEVFQLNFILITFEKFWLFQRTISLESVILRQI